MWCDSPSSVAAPPVLPSPSSLDSAESRGGQTPPWLIHGKAGVSEGIGGRKAWQTAHSGINARVLFCLLHFNSYSLQQRRRRKPAQGNTFHPKHDLALLLSPLTHFFPADFSELGILSLGRFSYISPIRSGTKARQWVLGSRKGWDAAACI